MDPRPSIRIEVSTGYISVEVSQESRFTPRMINARLVTVSDGSRR